MNKQLIKVIKLLNESSFPLTANELSKSLDISTRTVRNYIQEINSEYVGCISSSNKGYTIDSNIANTILSSSDSPIPQGSTDRVSYIINKIIKQDGVNSFDLCDEMYISYSTLKNELGKVRRRLMKNDLTLISNNNLLSISGTEKNKRKLLSSMMYEESANNFVHYSEMDSKFRHIDIFLIKEIIVDEFNKNHIFINDYSLENLVLHTTITIDRLKNGFSSLNKENINKSLSETNEFSLAKKIVKRLEEAFDVSFSETEVEEFCFLISSRATSTNIDQISINNIRDYVGEECYKLVATIITDFKLLYDIDLYKPEFLVRFALHIKNLLIRVKNDYPSKNPLTSSIKQNCPFIYDASVYAASLIHDSIGIELNEDEIAYIAFHIGGELEMKTIIENKITACLYSPEYYDNSLNLKEKLSEQFCNKLLIKNIISEEKDLQSIDADFLISTMKLPNKPNVPCVVINMFVTNDDLNNISEMISSVSFNKKKKRFVDYIYELTDDQLFESAYAMKDRQSIIHHMANKLFNLKYTDSNFESEVIKRDELSSTSFGLFAIPHSTKMDALKTGINILILEKPVVWGDNDIHLVIMLCFNKNERYIFNEIFESLSVILSDANNINRLITAKNRAEFVEILATCYK